MSLLNADPFSRDYYTVRLTTHEKKTAVRKYQYTPPQLLDAMGAMTLGQKYAKDTAAVKVESALFIYDYGKHAWVPVPAFGH